MSRTDKDASYVFPATLQGKQDEGGFANVDITDFTKELSLLSGQDTAVFRDFQTSLENAIRVFNAHGDIHFIRKMLLLPENKKKQIEYLELLRYELQNVPKGVFLAHYKVLLIYSKLIEKAKPKLAREFQEKSNRLVSLVRSIENYKNDIDLLYEETSKFSKVNTAYLKVTASNSKAAKAIHWKGSQKEFDRQLSILKNSGYAEVKNSRIVITFKKAPAQFVLALFSFWKDKKYIVFTTASDERELERFTVIEENCRCVDKKTGKEKPFRHKTLSELITRKSYDNYVTTISSLLE